MTHHHTGTAFVVAIYRRHQLAGYHLDHGRGYARTDPAFRSIYPATHARRLAAHLNRTHDAELHAIALPLTETR